MSSSAMVNPSPLPSASSAERYTTLREANASCRPSTMQFVMMSAMYGPIALCTSGTTASSVMSAIARNVAMIRM